MSSNPLGSPNPKKLELLIHRLIDLSGEVSKVGTNRDIRSQLQHLNDIQETVRRLGVALVERQGITAKGSKGRLRAYFLRHENKVLEGYELAIVAGVPTYGRRIRELRNEGMKILSGSRKNRRAGLRLGPDQYAYVR
jgi:hypothetical protein